jgi:hypothetical protein
MYSEHDYQDPANPAEELHVLLKEAANESGRSAEENEDAGETGNEEK